MKMDGKRPLPFDDVDVEPLSYVLARMWIPSEKCTPYVKDIFLLGVMNFERKTALRKYGVALALATCDSFGSPPPVFCLSATCIGVAAIVRWFRCEQMKGNFRQ